MEPIEAKMRSPKRGGREILRELTTPPEGSDSNKSTELPTVNPTKLIWAEQILTTIRCGGEFAPGEETLLGIEPGKFHQANVSIIDNLFTEFMVITPVSVIHRSLGHVSSFQRLVGKGGKLCTGFSSGFISKICRRQQH